MSAREDYIRSVRYPDFFHREQAPVWIATVMAALGYHVPGRRGTRWCELGCGQGFGATMLAASNPEMEFHGIDVNPDHIGVAQDRARRAGISNVHFHCADLREDPLRGMQFEFISCFGVFSWVPEQVRSAIVEFTASRLTDNGVASLHYMADPGGAVLRGFHSIFRSLAGREDALEEGFRLLDAMAAAEAGFFQLYPAAKPALERLKAERREYVAHEYLNPDFIPFAFHEVVSRFRQNGLDWCGSANPLENIDSLSVPAAAATALKDVSDPVLREGLKDLARNQTRRNDLFSRPRPSPHPREHLRLLDSFLWGLLPAVPQPSSGLRVQTPIGEVEADQSVIMPVLEILKRGPARFSEMMRASAFSDRPGLLNQTLQMLLHAGLAHPFLPGSDLGASARLNRELVAAALDGVDVPGLAAAPLGSGLGFAQGGIAQLVQTKNAAVLDFFGMG